MIPNIKGYTHKANVVIRAKVAQALDSDEPNI